MATTYTAVFKAVADFSGVREEAKTTSKALAEIPDGAAAEAESKAADFAGRLSGGLLKGVLVGAAAAGAALVTVLGVSLTKGFQRLVAIDTAKQKLLGLKMPAKTVEKVMDNALAAVKGTAFGLDEAATVAASAVASGVKPGKALERTLKLIADASAVAGTGMTDMGLVFNKVAATGKVNGEVLSQLGERGIPILKFLSKQLGVSAADVVTMASKGRISFADFQAAMQKGLGGSALASGNTFSGIVDNINASLGRFGANVLSGLFPKAKDGLKGLLDTMQNLEPVGKQIGVALGQFADRVVWLTQNIQQFTPILAGIGAALLTALLPALIGVIAATWAWTVALLANPFTWIVIGVGLLVAAIVWLVQNWDVAVAWITGVWGAFVTWLGGVWNAIVAGVMAFGAQVAQFFTNLWNGIVATAQAVWNGIVAFFQQLLDNLLFVIIGPLGMLALWIIANWDRISAAGVQIWNAIVAFIASIPQRIFDGLVFLATLPGKVGAWFMGVLTQAQTWFNQAVSFIAGVPNRVVNGLIALAQLGVKALEWFGGVYNSAVEKFGDVVDWVKGVPSKIVKALGDLGDLLKSSGKALVDGFLSGIKGAWDGLVGWVKRGMDRLRDLWPFSPAKAGPFSGHGYVTYSGEALTSDWAASIMDGVGRVGRAASAVVGAVANAVQQAGQIDLGSAVRVGSPQLAGAAVIAGSANNTSTISSSNTTKQQQTVYQLYLNDWQVGMDPRLEQAVRDLVEVVGDSRRLDRLNSGT